MGITIIIALGLALVIFLIWKNQKDEKDVVEYFNEESSTFQEDEEEMNDEK